MRLSHARRAISVRFDDPNLVSCAGLVPVMALADRCGLARLLSERLTIAAKGGANAAVKVLALIARMVCGADSIDDLDLLRHGSGTTCWSASCPYDRLLTVLRSNPSARYTGTRAKQYSLAVGCSRWVTLLANTTRIATRQRPIVSHPRPRQVETKLRVHRRDIRSTPCPRSPHPLTGTGRPTLDQPLATRAGRRCVRLRPLRSGYMRWPRSRSSWC